MIYLSDIENPIRQIITNYFNSEALTSSIEFKITEKSLLLYTEYVG